MSVTTGAAETEALGAELAATIEPGDVVVVSGEVGAGKTTLVKLLVGLYQPESGLVRYNGIDAASIDPEELRDMRTCLTAPAPVQAPVHVDWNAVHTRLNRLGAVGFHMDQVGQGQCRVLFMLPTRDQHDVHAVLP